MKKMFIPAAVVLVSLLGCQSNTSGKETQEPQDTLKTPQPEVDIRVNKEYDDQGNLIRMDSTYVWSYTNISGDTVNIKSDSLLGRFRPFTFNAFPDSMDMWLNPFFNYDSTFYTDFFHNDYFFDRWNKEFKSMERELHKLDSLRDAFLKREFPDLKTFMKPRKGTEL